MVNRPSNLLGTITQVYQAQALRWRDLVTTFIPLSVVVLLPLGVGILRSYDGYTHYGTAAASMWGKPWFSLSLLFLLGLLGYALYRLYRAHQWVAVHQGGIRIHLPPGRKTILLWSQLEGISTRSIHSTFLGFQIGVKHNLTIYPEGMKAIQIPAAIPDLAELGEELKQHLYPRLKQELAEQVRSGRPVYFGSVWISRQSLGINQESFPWKDISEINLRDGSVIVKFHNRTIRKIKMGSILNPELFLQFLEKVHS